MRPPTRSDASYTVDATPLSCSVSAAVNPAMPPPMIATRGFVGLAARASAVGPATATAAPIAPVRFRNSPREYAFSARCSRSSAGVRPSRSASACSDARRDSERSSGVRGMQEPSSAGAGTRRTWAIRKGISSPLTRSAADGTNPHALRSFAAARLSERVDRRGAVSPERKIDALDRRIIEALQENGRESFRNIAVQVGVSEATVRARYARLCTDDILQVVGVTNPLGLGFDQAMVGVRTSGPPDAIADEIARWPEADYVVATAGSFDLLVEVVCSDRRELLDLTNRMRDLEGVVSTETFLYLDMVKQLYDWGTK